MRLASTNVRDCCRMQRRQILGRRMKIVCAGKHIVSGNRRIRVILGGIENMCMCRNLGNRERVSLFAPPLAQCMAAADVNRRSPAKIRESESGLPIAAERCAQKREQRLILIDRQELSVAHGPAFRRKIKTNESDFRKKRFSHSLYSMRSPRQPAGTAPVMT